MDKIFAKDFMNELDRLSSCMNDVAAKIEEVKDNSEKLELREGIADLMSDLYLKLMRPVIIKHPDLDPDLENS